MEKTTFKDYKQAIKEQYVLAKEHDVSGILANPSPAQMRNLCEIVCDRGISKRDDEIFRLFFEPRQEESLKKAIHRCNIDRFKTIISFLKGLKDSEDKIRIEIAAILVGFENRPYTAFSKTGVSVDENDSIHVVSNSSVTNVNTHIENRDNLIKSDFFFRKGNNKRIAILIVIASILSGFALSKIVFKEKQCMQWQNNHYELVDCTVEKQMNLLANEIVPLDKDLVDFKKVEVSDTTTFFKNGKPVYWYCKVNGKLDFFNTVGNGTHPVSGKPLKPVSKYIIEKYVLNTN